MKVIKTCLLTVFFWVASAVGAEEKLPILKSGSEVYSNVTVTSVTATDIYFTHSGGIGNAKLKNLDPELQKHFHFDSAKAGVIEKKQTEATAQYKKNLLIQEAEDKVTLKPGTYDNGDLVVPKIFAHSFRGERPPAIVVDRWLTSSPPKPDGKFVMIFFWTAATEQCRSAIPGLNQFASKFKDRMIIIGLSNEPEEEIRKAKLPPVGFYVGTDTQSRSLLAFEVTMIPHAVLIDPAGIVRFEGPPAYLGEKDLVRLLDTYAP